MLRMNPLGMRILPPEHERFLVFHQDNILRLMGSQVDCSDIRLSPSFEILRNCRPLPRGAQGICQLTRMRHGLRPLIHDPWHPQGFRR